MLNWLGKRGASPIGIDLGSRWVKLVQFSRDRKQVLAAGRWELAPLPTDTPEPKLQQLREEQLALTIRRAFTERKFVGRDVVLCLSDKQIFLQNVRVAKPEGESLDRLVAHEASGRIPFSMDEAEIRYLEVADVRQGEQTLREVIVFACQRSVLQSLLSAVEGARLTPLAVDVEPAALLRSYGVQFRREGDAQERALMVHMGQERTAAVIMRGTEMLFVKYIDIGGSQLDAAVARHLRMEPAEAAALRRSSGDRRADLQDPDVIRGVQEAIRPVIDRLAGELSMCVRYHSVTFRGQPLVRLVLGGGEATPHLVESLTRQLNLKGELSDPFRAMTCSQKLSRTGIWDVAAGLALRDLN